MFLHKPHLFIITVLLVTVFGVRSASALSFSEATDSFASTAKDILCSIIGLWDEQACTIQYEYTPSSPGFVSTTTPPSTQGEDGSSTAIATTTVTTTPPATEERAIEQPTIFERTIVQPVTVTTTGLSEEEIQRLIEETENELRKEIAGISRNTSTITKIVAQSQRIDTLAEVDISDATIIDSSFAGSLEGTSGSFSQGLTVEGDAVFDTNTLVVDAANNRVGILDASPDHTLDVAGNIGLDASGYINFGDTDGTSGYGFRDNAGTLQYKSSGGSWADIGSGGGGMAIGGAITSGTSGSVLFVDASNQLAQDNSNFFWDDTNNRLGLGTSTPAATLDVVMTGTQATSGTEMITNSADRDFSSDTGNWSGTGWSISSGVASSTVGASAFTLSNSALSSAPESGSTYKIYFYADTSETGALDVSFGSVSYGEIDLSSSASVSVLITATGSGALSFTPDSSWEGSIDDISIKEMTASNAVMVLRDTDQSVGVEVRGSDSDTYGTFVGYQSGRFSAGEYNSAFGYKTLAENISGGGKNSAFGYQALSQNTTGDGNTAVGYRALETNVIGGNNTAIGRQTLTDNATGNYNTAIGRSALYRSAGGSENTAIGYAAMAYSTEGINNVAIGSSSLLLSDGGSNNIAIGRSALQSNDEGDFNIGLGDGVLSSNSGSNNIALGSDAMRGQNEGDENIALGTSALSSNEAGGYNIALGADALYSNTTGDFNIALGETALEDNETGSSNIAIGNYALGSISGGSSNVALGSGAGSGTGTISGNVFIGLNAGVSVETGSDNAVMIGRLAGDSVTTGAGNILMGYDAGGNVTTGSNNILIGYNIDAPSATGDNQLSIGNLIFATGGFGTGVSIGSGNVGILDASPDHTLDVAGNIGLDASGYINFGDTDGTSGYGFRDNAGTLQYKSSGGSWADIGSGGGGMAIGGAITSGTSGSVLFVDASNQLAQDNSNFFWDDTNDRLGLGTATPAAILDVKGTNTAATLGSEMISASADRDFSSDTGNWSGTNWSISSGRANHTAGANAFTLSNSALTSAPVSGTTYQIAFRADTSTDGTLNISFGSTSYGALSSPDSPDGTSITILITATGTGPLTFTPDASWVGYIDNVSVKAVALSDAILAIRNSDDSVALHIYGAGSGTDYNTFIGYQSGRYTAGDSNTFVGYQSGANNTIGFENVALGYQALYSNTSGYNNSAMGSRALHSNLSGHNNIALGDSSLEDNISGNYNIALGRNALESNTTGHSNISLGWAALGENTTGYENIAIGTIALQNNVTGRRNIALGYDSLGDNESGYDNVSIGYDALSANDDGYSNVAIGYSALIYNGTGSNNIAIGRNALEDNDAADYNIALGYYPLRDNTFGEHNIALGSYSLAANTTGGSNITLGRYSLRYNETGSDNVVLGESAGLGSSGNSNVHGNVLLGYNAGSDVETGSSYGVMIGYHAGDSVTTGGGNILMGYYAGENITTGARNILIGYDIDAQSATEDDQLSIGNLIFATGGFGTGTSIGSGNIGIGTASPTTFKLQVAGHIGPDADDTYNLGAAGNDWGCLYYNSGTLGTCASDERLKDDIELLTFGDDPLSLIEGLALRTFSFKSDETDSVYHGLIAQEVQDIAPSLVVENEDGFLAVKYGDIQWLLVEGMQKLLESVRHQTAAIADILARLTMYDEDMTRQSEEIASLRTEIERLRSLVEGGEVVQETDEEEEEKEEDVVSLTLIGNNPAEVTLGAAYDDLGALAENGEGDDLSVHVFMDDEEVETVTIDTSTPGTYTIHYRASYGDATGEISRTVIVGGGEEEEKEEDVGGNSLTQDQEQQELPHETNEEPPLSNEEQNEPTESGDETTETDEHEDEEDSESEDSEETPQTETDSMNTDADDSNPEDAEEPTQEAAPEEGVS